MSHLMCSDALCIGACVRSPDLQVLHGATKLSEAGRTPTLKMDLFTLDSGTKHYNWCFKIGTCFSTPAFQNRCLDGNASPSAEFLVT